MRPIVARDLMTSDVLTVQADMPVSELATFLSSHEITGAPVENGDGRVVGVVSVVDIARTESEEAERNVWEAASNSYAHDWDRSLTDGEIRIDRLTSDRFRVRDIMNPLIHAVEEETPVPEIAEKMLNLHLHRMLVVEDGRLEGIISTSDLIGLLIEKES